MEELQWKSGPGFFRSLRREDMLCTWQWRCFGEPYRERSVCHLLIVRRLVYFQNAASVAGNKLAKLFSSLLCKIEIDLFQGITSKTLIIQCSVMPVNNQSRFRIACLYGHESLMQHFQLRCVESVRSDRRKATYLRIILNDADRFCKRSQSIRISPVPALESRGKCDPPKPISRRYAIVVLQIVTGNGSGNAFSGTQFDILIDQLALTIPRLSTIGFLLLSSCWSDGRATSIRVSITGYYRFIFFSRLPFSDNIFQAPVYIGTCRCNRARSIRRYVKVCTFCTDLQRLWNNCSPEIFCFPIVCTGCSRSFDPVFSIRLTVGFVRFFDLSFCGNCQGITLRGRRRSCEFIFIKRICRYCKMWKIVRSPP